VNKLEIPLLRESSAFSARLIEAARSFQDPKYRFHRRVNWSYRYEDGFYQLESECFQSDPDAYLSGKPGATPQVGDVFRRKIGRTQLVNILLKVFAHWVFRLLGALFDGGIRRSGISIYRKAYVDDIELVFDPEEAGVVRAVYPFPISVQRQWRYLRFLHEQGRVFKLAGIPYRLNDLFKLLWRRDVRSLQQLESRAQLRHAQEVAALGVKTVQLSDEFDVGSLDFCRALARFPIHVVNSAHGVGKYFPVHAYQEFQVLTKRQMQYYYATRACRYSLRTLNDKGRATITQLSDAASTTVRFVFLSQLFSGVSEIIVSNEARVVQRLAAEFSDSLSVKLLYRAHPNSHQAAVPKGFGCLFCLEDANGQPGTIFGSFFSTCQIDPAFKGRKVLLRGELVYPEISFDDTEEILTLEELVDLLRRLGTPSQQALQESLGAPNWPASR
jgi:hypothetical protein